MPYPVLLTRPWHDALERVLASARERVTICSPRVREEGAAVVRRALRAGASRRRRALLVTDLSAGAICSGETDPAAIGSMLAAGSFAHARLVHLPKLQARIYAADGERAIVTTGELTGESLDVHHECGLLLDDGALAAQVEQDAADFAALGGEIDGETLARLCEIAGEARDGGEDPAEGGRRRRLERALRAASETTLRARLAQGPPHRVFSRTIEFLLRKHGPLPPERLQGMVRRMHADLCDAGALEALRRDRRLAGCWRSAMRTAQRRLEREGVVGARRGALSLLCGDEGEASLGPAGMGEGGAGGG